jgi:hypothetical protein
MKLRYQFHETEPIVVHESGACYLQVTWYDEETGSVVLIDQVPAPYAPFYQGEELERYVHAVLAERAKELTRQRAAPPQLAEARQRLAGRVFRIEPDAQRVVEIVEKELPVEVDRGVAPRGTSDHPAS